MLMHTFLILVLLFSMSLSGCSQVYKSSDLSGEAHIETTEAAEPLTSAKSISSEEAFAKPERKIIKTGNLVLLVHSAGDSLPEIEKIVANLNGFILSAQIDNEKNAAKSGTFTIRLPSSNFSKGMEQFKKIALKVEKEEIEAEDVTEEFVDQEAQLNNLKAEEKQYLNILKSARTIEDVLKVTERINGVRGKIDGIEGRLKYLARQVEMSTINLELVAENQGGTSKIYWKPLISLKNSFQSMINGFANYLNALIQFMFLLPVLALWVFTIGFFGLGLWKLIVKFKGFVWKKK